MYQCDPVILFIRSYAVCLGCFVRRTLYAFWSGSLRTGPRTRHFVEFSFWLAEFVYLRGILILFCFNAKTAVLDPHHALSRLGFHHLHARARGALAAREDAVGRLRAWL